MPHSTTQATSVTSGDKSTDNYTFLDPVYDTIDSDINGSNQVLLSEKYIDLTLENTVRPSIFLNPSNLDKGVGKSRDDLCTRLINSYPYLCTFCTTIPSFLFSLL